MASTKKKMTKAEKEERAKLYGVITSKGMMSSSKVNSEAITSLHQNTRFGENDFGEDIKMDIESLADVMEAVSDRVKEGDLSDLEEMLVCQTYSLQHIFMTMALKINSTTVVDHIDLFSRYALKAQNQCRSTIATLSEMKNPKRATFIKQQNNAVNQQINQDENSKNLDKPANELLEQTNGERLDTGKTEETIGANKVLEPVEKSNGT